MGYDPRTSAAAYGIFFVPKEDLSTCFDDIAIAMVQEGYKDSWYDALAMGENFNTYFFTAPAKNGDMFITAETYSENIIPTDCTKKPG